MSTDGVEPLYFITADDLTYQAKCPISTLQKSSNNGEEFVTNVKNNNLKKSSVDYQKENSNK